MSDDQATSVIMRIIVSVLNELGLVSVYNSSIDTKLLCAQRFVRLFAYGATTLILVSYFTALGQTDAQIGLFMTLTLVGDVLISFFLTLVADALGRKAILILGAILMVASGIVFAVFENYWILLLAATIGVISPAGSEIGPFRAIEESTLAHLSSPSLRPDIFAWYSLIGYVGTSGGMIACGWVVHTLQQDHEWHELRAYRIVFFAYAVLGMTKLVLALFLSKKIELEEEPVRVQDAEVAPLLGDSQVKVLANKQRSIFPSLSKESRAILFKLTLLFGLDSIGNSLASLSWITNFFHRKFDLDEGYLGSLFFTTTLMAALFVLPAASLARRFGNVKTMVFTQLPSATMLAVLGLPNSLQLAMVILVIRSCTQNMDVAPRTAFIASAVLPIERTAAMGYLNVVKTTASSAGPLVTGLLAGRNLFWVAFLIGGCLKIVFDLGLLVAFTGHKSREEEEADRLAQPREIDSA